MASIYGAYKRRGLFENKGDDDADAKPVIERRSPEGVVTELYNTYNQTALRYCEGDLLKAKKFLDVNITEYYEGLLQLKEYNRWYSAQMEKNKPK